MGLFGKKKKQLDQNGYEIEEPPFDNGDDTGIDYRDPEDLNDDDDEVELFENAFTANNDPDMEVAYDGTGSEVICPYCYCIMGFKDGMYMCTQCEMVMDREKFFDYIGLEPLGPECAECNHKFPHCIDCPHGYDIDQYDV